MSFANNNTQNVSTGKGVAGGYMFSAPRTTTVLAIIPLLSDFATPLSDEFVNVGYISSDGIVESESVSTDVQNDMNGDPINTSRSDRTETERFKLVEVKRDTLGEQYGHGNVSDEGGLITVHHNNGERAHRVYVAELVLKDGRRWRKIVPDGQVTEVADLTISSTEIVGREVTVSCNVFAWTDLAGSTHSDTVIDFIESTETPSPELTSLTLTNVTLSPSFAAGIRSYTGTTTSGTTTVTATAVAGKTVAIRCGENVVASGSATELVTGTNVVTVSVTDDETGAASTYRVTITKSA